MQKRLLTYFSTVTLTLLFLGCGSGTNGNDTKSTTNSGVLGTTTIPESDVNETINNGDASDDEFLRTSYKGLVFYHKNLPTSSYKLVQLNDREFNTLNDAQKLQVANKLLNSLFFAYPLKELKEKIDSGTFISDIQNGLNVDSTDKEWLENYILDNEIFKQYTKEWELPQINTILARFYAAKKLDKYFYNNWIAYILTQTILFSPSYELTNTHTPNISRVYNHLVNMLGVDSGMRFITYVHMMSEDNWRRFRSPEDNGREMLEIYLQDSKDSHVPLAGQALKNWSLNSDGDTLEVGLNKNRKPIELFGTTIYTGEDFYRELVKSSAFTRGVINRLVDFFFPNKTAQERANIATKIVSSKTETWQDVLTQILFSKEYLLNNYRAQSAEETFFSLAKKMNYRVRRDGMLVLRRYLESMHQASMKYKLGKIDRVPLDTLSFAYYNKYIRMSMLLRHTKATETNHDSWSYTGWQDSFVDFDKFSYDSRDDVVSLRALVTYLFETILGRDAKEDEQQFFKSHIIEARDGKELFKSEFNMFVTRDDVDDQERRREENKYRIVITVLDYISRLGETYSQREVK